MKASAFKRVAELLKSAPGALYRNRGLIYSVAGFAATRDAQQRKNYLEDIGHWIDQKTLPIVQEQLRTRIRTASKGAALAMVEGVEWIEPQLLATPHFGALQELTKSRLSRMDYVVGFLELLLRVKKTHAGLGLGSEADGSSSISFRGKPLTGLEITQLWALLLNCGHLFGTFATERALLYWLRQNEDLAEQFLGKVCDDLRGAARRILNTGCMYRFFYALVCYRITNCRMPDDLRRTAVHAVRLFLNLDSRGEGARISRLRRVYSQIRKICYLRLHNEVKLGGPSSMAFESDEMFDDLFGQQTLAYDADSKATSATQDFVSAVDVFQFRSFFTGKDSARVVLRHLREFKRWWLRESDAGSALDERIEALVFGPRNWPLIEPAPLHRFARLELPRADPWFGEVDKWLAAPSAWAAANFLLSYSPSSPRLLLVDVYLENEARPPMVWHVCLRLAQHCVASWNIDETAQSETLWRSIADFGVRLFNLILTGGLQLRIEPLPADDGSKGLALLAPSIKDASQRVRIFCERLKNEARTRELSAFFDYLAENHSSDDRAFLLFLGTTRIMDGEEMAAEIDGLCGFVGQNGIDWIIGEHRVTNQKTPFPKLLELERRLRLPLQDKVVAPIRGKLAVATTRWPQET